MMKLSAGNKISALFFIAVCAFALTGFSCRPRNETALKSNAVLNMWGLWQESKYLEGAIASFKEKTGVDVEYHKLASVADYEKKLLESFAEGRGPDIFVIHNSWVETKRGLMSPAPQEVIDERALREEFVDVVADDVIRDSQVYALPTSVDTLALYYNKDLLSSAGIARPPRTWTELQQIVERLTKVSRFGAIEQSAAALGAAQNISRASDIVQLLFLQSGLPIADKEGKVSLSNKEGNRSLTFYTDFANKSKKVFTWNLQQNFSIDTFAEGKTVMMIHYSYHIPTIKAKNPRLRFGIAPVPQIADSAKVNFASYWPYAVSNQSQAPRAAWAFLRYLTGAEQALSLNQASQTPPARRDAVTALQRDPVLGIFADQSLTAATWIRSDIVAINTIFNTMIDNVVTGAATVSESISRGQDQINQLQSQRHQREPIQQEKKGPPTVNIL